MAIRNTSIYDKQDPERINPARLPAQFAGPLHFASVPYTVEGDTGSPEATNDVINLCVLPVGAVVVPGASFIDCEALGDTFTVDIGYASNPDALADGLTLAAGGHFAFTGGTQPVDAPALAPLAEGDTTITATLAAVTDPEEEAKAVFHIAYKLPA